MRRIRGDGRDEGIADKEKHAGLLQLAQMITFLVVFAAGVVIGLTTSSHINRQFISSQRVEQYAASINHAPSTAIPQPPQAANCIFTQTAAPAPATAPPPPPSPPPSDSEGVRVNCMDMDTFLHPTNLTHSMSDDELFWRASLVAKIEGYPYKRTPKVAFMFLTRGPLPMLPLWERFFNGHSHLLNIYIHAPPGYLLNVSQDSAFYNRQIPSQDVSWGTVTLADAERRLLANALLDYSNERFVLLSESCIPVYNFPAVYEYLTHSSHSFVESYDEPTRYGRGRYSRNMLPHIHLRQWRKGSQWFEVNRDVAVYVVSDSKYYSLFRRFCKPACYPDEHYIPTLLNMFHGSLNSNRTVTWVNWSLGGPHPATYMGADITVPFLQSIRNNGTRCRYNSGMNSVCFLFARKFHPSALQPLLDLSSQVMNF